MSIEGKKLVIVSHTLHAKNKDNQVVGWGPTISEINYLSNHWEEVVHVSCFNKESSNASMLPYTNTNIRFSSIPTFGGVRFIDKISVFTKALTIIQIVLKEVKNASHVQIRVPMGIGVYVLPLFLFIPRKFILWVKYANNWGHVSNSLGYRFQRWFLDRNFLRCAVTINGFWPNQKKHLKSFENPCITEAQFEVGKKIEKTFDGKFKIVFAGRLEAAKGIDLLIETLPQLPKDKILEFVFIGEGPLRLELEQICLEQQIAARFLGFVGQEIVHQELYNAHFLVLPSKSEGFPKVVAQAWNYRCIPICSAVGSIPHYLIHRKNGFLMRDLTSFSLLKAITEAFDSASQNLTLISKNGQHCVNDFTFEKYLSKLKNQVFHDH